ncbi:hypothetical protein BH10PSE1_BH10PSE1_24100 [soil metagenome]
MTSIKTLTAIAAGVVAVSAAGAATAQTPYGQTTNQSQPNSQQEAFGAIVGALFGNGSSLDGQWLRGQRPLTTGRTQFETRLSADVRAGNLNSSSAARLRADYDGLVQQETTYSAGGFSSQERADLNQRYLDLTSRVDAGCDYGCASGPSVADGQTDFNARVDAGVSSRRLTRTAATRLRADYQTLVQTEATYRRDGSISAREQDDLDAQVDALDARVGDVPANGGGYGNGGYQPVLDNRTRLSNIDSALSTGERSGQINRTEAADIRVELGDITRLEAAWARTSPSRDDADYLTRRIGELEVRARVNVRR